MRIEFLYFEGCPHAGPARALLRQCLAEVGVQVPVREIEGDYPSPTIQVDGVDVMGAPQATGRACRLDVPTAARILAALRIR